jgi:cytoskeleton protein RodZ
LLHALEQCRFEDLGPPVFAKGYLKQYGNRLGLKYNDLLAEYYRLVEPQEVVLAPSRTIKLRDERQITVWIIAALALALLSVFLLVWWLGEPPTARAPTPAVSDEGETRTPAIGGAGETVRPDEVAREPGAGALGEEADPVAPPASESPAEGRATGGADTVAVATPAAALPSPASSEPESAEPTLTIEFSFLEDSWLEATDASGARLFYGLGQAGGLRRVTGQPPIDVVLGNANGVSLTVDGEPYVVPIRDRQRNRARFIVDTPTD